MEDMVSLLDVIVAKDEMTKCDFWREQPFVKLPDVEIVCPKSYHDLKDANSLADRYGAKDPLVSHSDVVTHITGGRIPTCNIPGLGKSLENLEATRKADFEGWLDSLGLDAVVWPCNTDVGKADADIDEESALGAWKNGVLYSNGNCAIRQLGIPTVNVPMGVVSDIGQSSSAATDTNTETAK